MIDYFLAPWRNYSDMQAQLMRLQLQVREVRSSLMARVDELRERLAAATDEIARDLEDLRGRLAQQDEALAAELEPMVARLEAMGQDPQNPVPDAPADGDQGGEPADGGGAPAGDGGVGTDGGDVVNPTPGAADNPNENA